MTTEERHVIMHEVVRETTGGYDYTQEMGLVQKQAVEAFRALPDNVRQEFERAYKWVYRCGVSDAINKINVRLRPHDCNELSQASYLPESEDQI